MLKFQYIVNSKVTTNKNLPIITVCINNSVTIHIFIEDDTATPYHIRYLLKLCHPAFKSISHRVPLLYTSHQGFRILQAQSFCKARSHARHTTSLELIFSLNILESHKLVVSKIFTLPICVSLKLDTHFSVVSASFLSSLCSCLLLSFLRCLYFFTDSLPI